MQGHHSVATGGTSTTSAQDESLTITAAERPAVWAAIATVLVSAGESIHGSTNWAELDEYHDRDTYATFAATVPRLLAILDVLVVDDEHEYVLPDRRLVLGLIAKDAADHERVLHGSYPESMEPSEHAYYATQRALLASVKEGTR